MDLQKILEAFNLPNEKALASEMKLSKAAISNWKKRGIGDGVKLRLMRKADERGVQYWRLGLDD